MAIGILALSDDILSMIIALISTQTPTELSQLNLVHRRFRKLTLRFQFRTLTLTPSNIETLCLGGTSLRKSIVSFTRNLSIESPDYDEETCKGEGFHMGELEDLLSEFENLVSITWKAWKEAIPASLLTILQSRFPKLQIYLQDLPMRSRHHGRIVAFQDHGLKLLDNLDTCPNITSISVILHSEHPLLMRRVMDIATSCPNLEVLQLIADRVNPNGLEDPAAYLPYNTHIQNTQQLPPLRKLIYESNDTSSNILLIPHTFWNWTKIRHLELRGRQMSPFIRSITGQIEELESLKIDRFAFAHPNVGDDDHLHLMSAISNFILSLRTLTELEIVNPFSKFPVAVFEHLGPTLQTLSFHGPSQIPHWDFPLSSQDLLEVAGACPNITSLTVDLLILDELPTTYLSALSTFPALKTLHILARTMTQQHPYQATTHRLSADTLLVTTIFNTLFTQKIGCPFNSISILFKPHDHRPSRPEILFTCRKREDGVLVVVDDSYEADGICFEGYIDGEGRNRWEEEFRDMRGRNARAREVRSGEEARLWGSPSPPPQEEKRVRRDKYGDVISP